MVKIECVDGIKFSNRFKIVEDYIVGHCTDNGEPIQTKKGTGCKIESCGRLYHVSCRKTSKSWIFSIWNGV